MFKKVSVAIAAVLLLTAAISPVTMQPGDSLSITCSTQMSGSIGATSATLFCAATPTPSPTPSPTPTPIPTATPSPGVVPPQYGSLFRWTPSMGMSPWKILTYPDQHPGDNMEVYNRFTPGQASIHDGFLDLKSTRRFDGLWSSTLVGTSQSGNGPTFGYGVFRYWLSFNVTSGGWQSAWLYDTTSWSVNEIDFPEMLENLNLTAHVFKPGASSVGKYGLPKPADLATKFHEFKVERRATFVAFSIDGVEVWRTTSAQPSTKLAILLDSKVGFPWGFPPPTTAAPYLHIAGVTVDP